jgi:hypothetical protein
MFHQLHVELCSSNEELSTFLENFEYTIKKYENSIFYFIGKRLTNGQTETLKIRFGQCFNVIGQLLYNI